MSTPKYCTFPRCLCTESCRAREPVSEVLFNVFLDSRTEQAADVPNRLYGATINHEGDAV